MRNFQQLALVLTLALSVGAADAQEASQTPPPELSPEQIANTWIARSIQAREAEDYEAWVEALEQLRELRPHNPNFMHQLVSGYALLDKKQEAFNMMLLMQRQGMSYDWDDNPHVSDEMRETRLYEYLNTLMIEAGQHYGEGEVAMTLDAEIAIPEALAHDPETGRLFLGTLKDGRILVKNDDDEWRPFAESDEIRPLESVLGLAVDAGRRHLWVSTGMTPQFKRFRQQDFGRTALLKFELDSGELLGEYRVLPDGNPHLLASLALADDGTVYAADTQSPAIYRLAPDAERPRRLLQNPIFTSLRGVALSDDGTMLYFADYELGLFVANVETEEAWHLAVPEDLNVGGVDGLFWWDGDLVMIQSGFSPQRVMRLELGEDGLGVVGIQPLESGHPAFDHPTNGTIIGDDLYYFGGSHWPHMDARGRPVEGTELPDIPIVVTNLESTHVMQTGQQILERIRRGENPLGGDNEG